MITVENLRYTYPGRDEPAVRDIAFAVQPGEIFGFLGPSGAGKSTTQRILIGLLKEYEGSIKVFDRDLKGWRSDYYERVGVSFELPNHYRKLTALENLQLFAALYQRPTRDPVELLALVGLADDAKTRVSAFSKGMQMRLNFARALIHNPDLLFLDEPTAGLDPGNGRKIKDMILDLKRQGCTIFLTTHDMYVADEICDRVAFIADGRITRIDSPRALKLQHGRRVLRVEYLHNGGTSQREYPLEKLGENRDFLELVRDAQIETMHTEEATLEDIFVSVTGRSLQ